MLIYPSWKYDSTLTRHVVTIIITTIFKNLYDNEMFDYHLSTGAFLRPELQLISFRPRPKNETCW